MGYMKSRPELFISLGFQATEKEKRSVAGLYSLKNAVEPSVKTSTNEEKSGYFTADVFPFIVHLGLMATTAFFIMHVQVATRSCQQALHFTGLHRL
ncbi:unnamed protein product [Arabidopsis halleri]